MEKLTKGFRAGLIFFLTFMISSAALSYINKEDITILNIMSTLLVGFIAAIVFVVVTRKAS